MRYLPASLGCLILALPCAAQTQSAWQQIKPKTAPSARYLHGMAYDSSRELTVMFGGWDGNKYLADTWEWDGPHVGDEGKLWSQVQTQNSPSKRNSHAMCFDTVRRVTVVFGGWNGSSYLADTWEYDGKDWKQVQTSSAPPGRLQAAMIYDEARQRTVLFGGLTANGRVGDTWEWDGKTWVQKTPKTSPPLRSRHTMAYDSARRLTVLFGGQNSSYLADTWEWDGTDWKQVKTNAAPPKRIDHAMAYDTGRQRMVVFGGYDGFNYLGDTWEFDGNDWEHIRLTTSPANREKHRMVYDTVRQRTVLFGGSGSSYLGDTWEYAGPTLTLTADISVLPITGGAQTFTLAAGRQHAGRNYWIFGTLSGTTPGIQLGSLQVPLNPDPWTTITIAQPNTPVLTNTRGVLDASGAAQAAFNVPSLTDLKLIGLVFHHAYIVYDLTGTFHMASNPVSLLLVAPQDRVVEVFADAKQVDTVASSGTWGGNKVTFGNIGGDGLLGEFNHANGKALGGNVWEWSTDGGTTIPAVQCLDNQAHTITDGVFNFSTFVLPAGVTINFVGKNPVQISARGEMQILGRILVNGVDLKVNAHKGTNATGEKGSNGGAGGGAGGNGGDMGDGNSNKSNFNGQDGQDCQLPSGHAYAANASTTGGPGSKQYPADGKQGSVLFSLFNVIAAQTTPGGSGGGNLTAGGAGSALWKDSSGKPHATLNKEIGPAPAAGTALGWAATKPTNAKSLAHHQVGGSGGGGGGSCPLGALSPGSSGPKISFHSGRAGAGGGGAIAIRSGRLLTMGSQSVIEARGGSASGNLSAPFTDGDPVPGGAGSGGTIFFQVDGTTTMNGSLNVSGGNGGLLIDSPTGDTITATGGNGGVGVIRMETVGTLNKSRLGTTVPAAKDTDVQKLTDTDRFVGIRSKWYEANLTNPPKFVRYEIHAKIDGKPVVYSDDNKIGTLATRGGTPIAFFAQGAQLKKNASGGLEVIPNTIKPWRRYVGPFVAGQSLAGDGAHGFRFTLLLDRSFGKTVEVQDVVVFYSN